MPVLRTTPDLVKGIITTKVRFDLTPFITAANSLTTNICGLAKPPYADTGINSTMELIERWLSAHAYTIFDNPIARANVGQVGAGYQYKVDMCLDSSMYGQMALLLDTQGLLAAYSNTAKTKRRIYLKMEWLGRRHGNDWQPWGCGDINDWDIATICQ